LILSAAASRASAEGKLDDRVVLRPKGRTSRITLHCTIIDYTGRSITVRTAAGTIRSYPAGDVVKVTTPQTEQHVQGLLAFTKQKYEEALKSFEKALAEEERPWVRREILALMVRSALQTGDHDTAAARFIELVKSDRSTSQFHLIPLTWTTKTISAAQKAQARAWLVGAGAVARLIAASQLLNDPLWGKPAENALAQLTANADTRISGLAEVQLWRKRLARRAPGPNELAVWKKQIERLPDKLRGGPYYVLGRAHLLRNEHEQAAAAFLWLPLVYTTDRELAARGCLEAADALAEVGRKNAALTLYREVGLRFSDTEYAQEASAQIEKLRTPAESP